jgi:hypothetical protein
MTESKKTTPTDAPTRVALVYHGPSGQQSPLFGPLEVGQYYEADASFAAYLCLRHPEYWATPKPKTPDAPAAKE